MSLFNIWRMKQMATLKRCSLLILRLRRISKFAFRGVLSLRYLIIRSTLIKDLSLLVRRQIDASCTLGGGSQYTLLYWKPIQCNPRHRHTTFVSRWKTFYTHSSSLKMATRFQTPINNWRNSLLSIISNLPNTFHLFSGNNKMNWLVPKENESFFSQVQ